MSTTPPRISPQAVTQAPSPDAAKVVLIVLMWVAWVGVTIVVDALALLMFAFADSPGAASVAQRMIVPAFAWIGFTFVAGIVLLVLRRWWTVALAFVLAVSPPFAVFAGYNVFSGANTGSNAPATYTFPDARPAPRVNVPPGGFRPEPTTLPVVPDFRKQLEVYRNAADAARNAADVATSRPADATTQP